MGIPMAYVVVTVVVTVLCPYRRVEARFSALRETISSPYSTDNHPVHPWINSELQSLWDFQTRSSRNQRISTIGQLHVAQLRQVRGCSVSAAGAISKRFGGTMLNMHMQIYSITPVAVEVSFWSVDGVLPLVWRLHHLYWNCSHVVIGQYL